jgi:cytochrome c553
VIAHHSILLSLSVAILLAACQSVAIPDPRPGIPSTLDSKPLSPAPTIDRLAEPLLPPNPTQLEKGRHLFRLNCAACHGDRGQGLTDEYRSLYVEDTNFWARGCHAGHNGDQGFPIPRTIPAVISSSGDLQPFKTSQALFQ